MKYIVWFSWWIDSTYVWYELKKMGHEVLFINLKNTIWTNKCCSLPTDLFEIAKKINIPLEIIDVTKEFKNDVINNFIEIYMHWKTPNPCINCNELVRFKILDKIREKYWFDKVTTGHYAKIYNHNWQNFLSMPKDEKKDQTYMLYRISNIHNKENTRILNNMEFVLSDKTKEEIKNFYETENLPLSVPKESQNICFIPDDDYTRFIKQSTSFNFAPGKILDTSWKYLGEHKWIIYYTIWQRHWLNLDQYWKLYVIRIDWDNNLLIVWQEEELKNKVVNLEKIFIHFELLDNKEDIYGKIRYHHKIQKIKNIEINWDSAEVGFEDSVRAPTPWQHCVLYKKIWENFVVIWWWIIK